MRATQRSLLVLLFVFICNMALVAPTLGAAPKEKSSRVAHTSRRAGMCAVMESRVPHPRLAGGGRSKH